MISAQPVSDGRDPRNLAAERPQRADCGLRHRSACDRSGPTVCRGARARARPQAHQPRLRRDIANIEYAQADILKLGSLGRSFDLIEPVGVLHHLRDWSQGWRVLLALLRPGGFMHVGLYSELARADIRAARAFIAERGARGEKIPMFGHTLQRRAFFEGQDFLTKFPDIIGGVSRAATSFSTPTSIM
jgi:SAM-dependent methyltransferase